ncbi:Molydopterin dinucleotide binding domain-containing protein [Desulfuromusa kysingii]|uniref:Molydopterin dinucleotide binding domain-containing protein n=1 Tax=Desulfuromusa kysingii TaxID=37625 RepID=A0A1H4A2V7_9BACT|nr:molybdopterin-dependent oxidoreductase [Desulfuromusa kysingii]SEA30345.1 Molydopterin dinucleotide binding domain-containing protein [Desulfuromusa kysingii]
MAKETIYSHCRACHLNCPASYDVEDGEIKDIHAIPFEEGGTGNLCLRAVAGLQLLNSPTRVKYPMKRVGKRGEGKWERVSWEQAIDEIGHKVVEMSEKYGPETFVFPGRTGRQDMGWIAHKLARTIGTPNNYYGPIQVCLLPQMHHAVTYGNMLNLPYFSGPDTKLRVAINNASEYAHPLFGALQKMGEDASDYPIIALDPVGGILPSRATEWLPIRPGTDLAFCMCIIRHLIETNQFESDFVKQWTNAPFLVREDTGSLLMESDVVKGGSPRRYMFWDAKSDSLKWWDAEEIQWQGGKSGKAHYEQCEENFRNTISSTEHSPAVMPDSLDPALRGTYEVKVGRNGCQTVKCSPALELCAQNCAEWTFEKTSEVTWTPVDRLERAAELIATIRPVDFFEGGQYMSTNASQYFNAAQIIKMLTGSIDVSQGTGFAQFYPVTAQAFPGEFDISYANGLPTEMKRKRLGYWEHRIGCGFAFEQIGKWHPMQPENADATLNFPDIGCVLDAAETGRPYPVHGMFSISSNWLMHDPSTARWLRLLKDEEKIQLHVVTDFVMTPTAELADYVLPAQTWFERNYLEFSVTGMAPFKNAFSRVVEPIGEAKHDYDICAMIAHKLEEIKPGYNSNQLLNPANAVFWGGKVGKLWENNTIDEERDRWCRAYTEGNKSWKQCLEEHKVSLPESSLSNIFERYRVSGKFPTDTGKANFFSTLHEMAGYPPLPVYTEPAESPLSRPDLAKEYPLVLSTGKRQAGFFHSEFRQLPYIREVNPVPEIFINAETAKEYGVKHGDWVWLESSPCGGRAPHNKVMGQVSLRFMVLPGLVSYSQHGWWRPEKSAEEEYHGGLEWNAENVLETVNRSPETGTAGLRSQLCKIYKCSEEDIKKYQPMITREQMENLMPQTKEEV